LSGTGGAQDVTRIQQVPPLLGELGFETKVDAYTALQLAGGRFSVGGLAKCLLATDRNVKALVKKLDSSCVVADSSIGSAFTCEGVLQLHYKHHLALRTEAETRALMVPLDLSSGGTRRTASLLRGWATAMCTVKNRSTLFHHPAKARFPELFVPEDTVYAVFDPPIPGWQRVKLAADLGLGPKRLLVDVSGKKKTIISQGRATKTRLYHLPLAAVGRVLMQLLWDERRPCPVLVDWLEQGCERLVGLLTEVTSQLAAARQAVSDQQAAVAAAKAKAEAAAAALRQPKLAELAAQLATVVLSASPQEVSDQWRVLSCVCDCACPHLSAAVSSALI
jgi:hypothetical protein